MEKEGEDGRRVQEQKTKGLVVSCAKSLPLNDIGISLVDWFCDISDGNAVEVHKAQKQKKQ